MTVISKLTTLVDARVAPFVKSMRTAKKSASGFGAQIKKLRPELGALSKSFGGIGSIVAGGGIAIGLKSIVNELDHTIDVADKLGMSVQHLQGMREAARMTGIEAGTLDMALQRMTRRIAEAASGTGEAKGALQELGLSAERLNQIGPHRAFSEIADAMNEVDNQSDKLRLAFKLFDSEGAALVRTLSKGKEELAEMYRRAEEGGRILSPEDVKASRELINNLKEVDGLWKSINLTVAKSMGNWAQFARRRKEEIKASGAVGQVEAWIPWTPITAPMKAEVRQAQWQHVPKRLDGRETAAEAKARRDAVVGAGQMHWTVAMRNRQRSKRVANQAESWMRAVDRHATTFREQEQAQAKARAQSREDRQRASELAEEFKTPFERFSDTMEDLYSMRSRLGASFDETFSRAGMVAAKEYAATIKKDDDLGPAAGRGVAAARRGSAADFIAQRRAVQAFRNADKNSKALLDESRKHTDLFEDMVTILDVISKDTVAVEGF